MKRSSALPKGNGNYLLLYTDNTIILSKMHRPTTNPLLRSTAGLAAIASLVTSDKNLIVGASLSRMKRCAHSHVVVKKGVDVQSIVVYFRGGLSRLPRY